MSKKLFWGSLLLIGGFIIFHLFHIKPVTPIPPVSGRALTADEVPKDIFESKNDSPDESTAKPSAPVAGRALQTPKRSSSSSSSNNRDVPMPPLGWVPGMALDDPHLAKKYTLEPGKLDSLPQFVRPQPMTIESARAMVQPQLPPVTKPSFATPVMGMPTSNNMKPENK